MIWKFLKQNGLFPKGLNWVQHWSPVQTDSTLLANNSQHCWILHVASVCTPCFMLLDVVVCCCAKFETGQTFQLTTPDISFVPWSPKRNATMLDPFAQLFQHWGHARSLRMVYKDLWVVSFLRCTAGPKIVRSCCIRLQTTANTHATTPNIVAPIMLGVVASVWTKPELAELGLFFWCIQLNSDWLNCYVAKEISCLIPCGLRKHKSQPFLQNESSLFSG